MAEFSFAARPPAAAVGYFQTKTVGGRFSFDWRDVWEKEHLASFVVAKMMRADLLKDVHDALTRALAEGWSKDRFIKELRPTLEAKGWWGRQKVTDPRTGVERVAQLGSRRRLTTIFETNMRMAHAAARWERTWEAREVLPNLRYRHTPQERPRPQHLAWDGITLPVTHVFWKTHWCPNGWRCKCWTQQLGPDVKVTTDEELAATGYGKETLWLDKRAGVFRKVPVGIDPGFAYNVGEERLAGLTPPPAPEPQRQQVVGDRWPRALPAAPAPRPLGPGVTLRPDLDGKGAGEVFDAFSKVIGKAEGELFTDRAQVPVVIGRRLFEQKSALGEVVGDKAHLLGRASWAELLGQALKDPDEIWHSIQLSADGTLRFVRNYVAAIEDPSGERFWFVVTFTDDGGMWWGTTAYGPGKRGKPRTQEEQTARGHRVGALVYSRK